MMKIKTLRKATSSKFLDLYELDYIDMKGNAKSWEFVSRNSEPKCVSQIFNEPDAVVIVPFHTEKQKLVLIEEFRVPLAAYQYGFPAGLVDKGESVAEAGSRELEEETGLQVTAVLKQSPPVYTTSGLTDESVVMLYVECTGEPDHQHNESSEDINVHFVSRNDATALMNTPAIKFDVKTWLVLSVFATQGHV